MIQLKQLKQLKTTGSTVVDMEKNIVAVSENKQQPKEEAPKAGTPVVDVQQPAVEVPSTKVVTEEKVEAKSEYQDIDTTDDELEAMLAATN